MLWSVKIKDEDGVIHEERVEAESLAVALEKFPTGVDSPVVAVVRID